MSADSSNTPGVISTPSTGTTSPVFTNRRSPGRTSSIGRTTSSPPSYRVTIWGARSSRAESSRWARRSAYVSSARPLASISAITAPARYSSSANEPPMASRAMRSTPASRRISPVIVVHVSGTSPIHVVTAHATCAASWEPDSHRMPPTVMPDDRHREPEVREVPGAPRLVAHGATRCSSASRCSAMGVSSVAMSVRYRITSPSTW